MNVTVPSPFSQPHVNKYRYFFDSSNTTSTVSSSRHAGFATVITPIPHLRPTSRLLRSTPKSLTDFIHIGRCFLNTCILNSKNASKLEPILQRKVTDSFVKRDFDGNIGYAILMLKKIQLKLPDRKLVAASFFFIVASADGSIPQTGIKVSL